MRKANQAKDGLLRYEAGQEYQGTAELLRVGSTMVYRTAGDTPWSGAPGTEAEIYPDGMVTGGAITPGAAGEINIAAISVRIGGVERTSAADNLALPVGTLTIGNTVVFSITVFNNSGTLEHAAAAGTNGAFTETRAVAGGPPLIPANHVEIGWVRATVIDLDPGGTPTAGIGTVEQGDILQVIPGLHYERYDHPMWGENFYEGSVEFYGVLPASHTGPATKKVYAVNVHTPQLAPIEPATDFVPPETTYTQSSEEVYGGTIGSSSSSLGQGSFKAFLKDGVTDDLVSRKGQKLWFQFFPDRYRSPHLFCQGILGIKRSYPPGSSINAECTITADAEAEGRDV